MKIQIKVGKLIFLYIDTKNKNKIVLSFINNDTLRKIKKKNYIKVIQSKLEGNIELGDYISITNAILSSTISKIIIKNFCSIAPNVCIISHLHNYERMSSYYIFSNILKQYPNNDVITRGDILIEEDVWIGAGAVILSGVTIGRGSIVGANAVCNKSIEKYSIMGGVPARVLKKRFSKEQIYEIEISKWWNWKEKQMEKNKKILSREIKK